VLVCHIKCTVLVCHIKCKIYSYVLQLKQIKKYDVGELYLHRLLNDA